MRPLGLSDTIFYNLRDAQITAAAALDGPCDLPGLIAGIEGATASLPGFTETPVRLGVWSFARQPQPVDIARHASIVVDPSIVYVEQLVPLLDRLRRNRIAVDGPQWRMIVLNPAGMAPPGAISAVFGQLRHGLADGTRTIQALASMAEYQPTAAHVATAGRLPTITFGSLPSNVVVHDVGPIALRLPRGGMAREGDASARLAAAAVAAVEDPRLFPDIRPLRGNIGRTRFVARRAGAGGAGNYIRMETITRGDAPRSASIAIPGLAHAQDLPVSQWAVAVAPGPVARWMMRLWYANFDAIATLIPLPRRLRLGGRAVTDFLAAAPLWGPVPLVALAFADAEHYHLTLYPARGFAGDVDALRRKLRDCLNPGMREPAASPAA
jgi:hypothetical protein